MKAFVLCTAFSAVSAAGSANILGYKPGTDVKEHSEIDLDMADILTELGKSPNADFGAAKTIYTAGKYSTKSSGLRTIAGMPGDQTGEAEFDKMVAYYGDKTFANKWVTGALDGTKADFTTAGDADFATVNDEDTREQGAKKGMVYINVWQYAVHELESAMSKCSYTSTDQNEAAVHAWDEAVAFYTGSLPGTTMPPTDNGNLVYALAQGRCNNFGTCDGADGTSGVAKSSREMFADFDIGRDKLRAGYCAGLRPVSDRITAQGFVPIIQGTMKYAATMSSGLKARAEAATFFAALAGRLNHCSTTAASTVYDKLKIGVTTATGDFAVVKTDMEAQYGCMGVTCADIGKYGTDTACTDVLPKIGTGKTEYTPATRVTAHAAIDLDQKAIQTYVADKTQDLDAAKAIFRSVSFSARRYIGQMPKDHTGEGEFDKMVAYYGTKTFAQDWVNGALDSTKTTLADFATVKDGATREQAVKKGTAYISVWQYAIHEMESAISKCSKDTTASAHAWDEAVAFYTGQDVATSGGKSNGYLMYALSESRGSNFATGTAAQEKVFEGFNQGLVHIQAGKCDDVRAEADKVIKYGFVPIIQGVLKYGWETSSLGSKANDLKYQAEAAVFAAALVGRLNACSKDAAKVMIDETKIGLGRAADFPALKKALEDNYACMKVTCADVGQYQKSGAMADGFTADCSNPSSGLSTGALVGIIVGGVVGALLIAAIVYKLACKGKAKKPKASGGSVGSAA